MLYQCSLVPSISGIAKQSCDTGGTSNFRAKPGAMFPDKGSMYCFGTTKSVFYAFTTVYSIQLCMKVRREKKRCAAYKHESIY